MAFSEKTHVLFLAVFFQRCILKGPSYHHHYNYRLFVCFFFRVVSTGLSFFLDNRNRGMGNSPPNDCRFKNAWPILLNGQFMPVVPVEMVGIPSGQIIISFHQPRFA